MDGPRRSGRRRGTALVSLRAMHRSPLARRVLVAALAIFAAATLASPGGCTSTAPVLCGEIPPGGCPVGRGGTCVDRTCAALFDCVAGTWTITQSCPELDGGTDGGGGSDAGAGTGGGGPCTPVRFDHQGERPDCTPDLESPDCPAVAAEGCAESACSAGCTDFFLCLTSGWTAVGYCDDSGRLTVTQK